LRACLTCVHCTAPHAESIVAGIEQRSSLCIGCSDDLPDIFLATESSASIRTELGVAIAIRCKAQMVTNSIQLRIAVYR